MDDDGSPLALVFGQRWSLPIVAALVAGPMRFGALRAAIPGLSANLLSHRLEALAAAGVLDRVMLPPPASARAYALTPWGAQLGPILADLRRWAAIQPVEPTPVRTTGATLHLGLHP